MSKKTGNGSFGGDDGALGDGELLTLREVLERTTLSRSQLYRLLKAGQFPPFLQLGARSRALPEDMLDAWLESRMDARDHMRGLEDEVRLPPWVPGRPSGAHPVGIRMMPRAAVEIRVGFGKSEIYRLIAEGAFPRPVPLTERRRAWAVHEVEAWRRQRVEEVLRVRGLSLGELAQSHLLPSVRVDESSEQERDPRPSDPSHPRL